MKIFSCIFLIFIYISCEQTILLRINAEKLKEIVHDFKGEKAVLVNVWALWCRPCIEEFPMILKLDQERKDLEVIFVNADFEDDIEDVVNFLNKHNIGQFSYIKQQKDELFIEGLHPSWSGSLPFTIVYGKNSSSIIDYWEGKKSESRFVDAISGALIH